MSRSCIRAPCIRFSLADLLGRPRPQHQDTLPSFGSSFWGTELPDADADVLGPNPFDSDAPVEATAATWTALPPREAPREAPSVSPREAPHEEARDEAPAGEPTLAVLQVVPLSVSHLRSKASSVHVVMKVGADARKTPSISGSGPCVQWSSRHTLTFLLEAEDQQLDFEVFLESRFSVVSTPELLGSSSLPLLDLRAAPAAARRKLPLYSSGTRRGDLEVELRLLAGEGVEDAIMPPLVQGDSVEVWSKSQESWIPNCLVDEISRRGPKVRYPDGVQCKWITPDIESHLRRPFVWQPVGQDQPVPERAVMSGKGATLWDGELYVGRSRDGAPGKLTLRLASGPKVMSDLWCHSQRSGMQVGEVLCLFQGFAASWHAVRHGDPLPSNAVRSSQRGSAANAASAVYVARNEQGEAGKLSLKQSPDGDRVDYIWCHHHGRASQGEALLVDAADAELTVHVLRCEGLRSPEYRLGDMTRKLTGLLAFNVYVTVRLSSGATWQSSCRDATGGDVEFRERVHFPFQPRDGETAPLRLDFRVYGKRSTNIRGDSMFGEGCMQVSAEALHATEPISLDLRRDGASHGRLLVRVQEWRRRP